MSRLLVGCLGLFSLVGLTHCGASDSGDRCAPNDADGVVGVGETYRFEMSVDDAGFTPKILTAQNRATIRLVLQNDGTTPHDFAIACLPTPNDNGCPAKSCFPDGARSSVLAPGEQTTLTFDVPVVEGLYDFRSSEPGDTQAGQFVVQ